MVGGRWFFNMFWGVNIILKGEEVYDILGGVKTEVHKLDILHMSE